MFLGALLAHRLQVSSVLLRARVTNGYPRSNVVRPFSRGLSFSNGFASMSDQGQQYARVPVTLDGGGDRGPNASVVASTSAILLKEPITQPDHQSAMSLPTPDTTRATGTMAMAEHQACRHRGTP